MRERRFGRIVVISSVAAAFGMPARVAYSASKAGLLGMVLVIDGGQTLNGLSVTRSVIRQDPVP